MTFALTADACATRLNLAQLGQGSLYDSVLLLKAGLGDLGAQEDCTEPEALASAVLDALDRVDAQAAGSQDGGLRHSAYTLQAHFAAFAAQLTE